jgi:phosphomannomutase
VTSTGLTSYIKGLGGRHHRFKRGYKNVINEAIRLNNAGEYTPLAIETSGHAALKENYFLDDGSYLVTRLIIEMIRLGKEGKRLTDLISDLKEAPVSKSLRFTIQTENFKEYGENILDDFSSYVACTTDVTPEAENYEGVRINFEKALGSGWLLIRLSLHDPVMPVDIETETEQDLKTAVKYLFQFISKYDRLDISKLTELL